MNGNGTPIMHARDAISAALAECFVTIAVQLYAGYQPGSHL